MPACTAVVGNFPVLKIMHFLLLKLEKVVCKIMAIIYHYSFLLCCQPERIIDRSREKQREEGRRGRVPGGRGREGGGGGREEGRKNGRKKEGNEESFKEEHQVRTLLCLISTSFLLFIIL